MFLGQEVHYYIVYIAYFTELNLQICDYAQKQRICRENCQYAFDEKFHGHFCPRRNAANFCHPDHHDYLAQDGANVKPSRISTDLSSQGAASRSSIYV